MHCVIGRFIQNYLKIFILFLWDKNLGSNTGFTGGKTNLDKNTLFLKLGGVISKARENKTFRSEGEVKIQSKNCY